MSYGQDWITTRDTSCQAAAPCDMPELWCDSF